MKTHTGVELKDLGLFRDACFIDGAWVGSSSGSSIAVDNPATGEIIGAVPSLGRAETRQAIEAADRAFHEWRKKTGKERAAVLRTWFDLMMANQEDLARLMTIEQGKPLAESRGEVAYAASFLEWFGEEAKRVYGDTIPAHQADKRLVVIKQPIGVVACITPWNFPLAMITRKAGPGHRRRLHRRAEARVADAVLRPGAGGARAARRSAERRVQRDHGIRHRDWRGADGQSDGPQTVVHRIDRDRQEC